MRNIIFKFTSCSVFLFTAAFICATTPASAAASSPPTQYEAYDDYHANDLRLLPILFFDFQFVFNDIEAALRAHGNYALTRVNAKPYRVVFTITKAEPAPVLDADGDDLPPGPPAVSGSTDIVVTLLKDEGENRYFLHFKRGHRHQSLLAREVLNYLTPRIVSALEAHRDLYNDALLESLHESTTTCDDLEDIIFAYAKESL